MKFDPTLLAKWAQGQWNFYPDRPLMGFTNDSRRCKSLQCFLALKTENDDGHRYLKDVYEKGASAAIVECIDTTLSLPQLKVSNTLTAFQRIAGAYRSELTHIPIFAITGSYGKTTAKELLALLLGESAFKSPKNFNNFLGVPLSLMQLDPTIHSRAVLEVGVSLPSEMDPLVSMIRPDGAIVLNVGPVHLGNFNHSLEAIANEKALLLKKCFNKKSEHFFPAELLNYAPFYALKDSAFIFINKQCERKWSHIPHRLIYEFHPETSGGWNVFLYENKELLANFSVPFLIGEGLLYTFAATLFVALKQGIKPERLQQRLNRWEPSHQRGEWLMVEGRHFFVDCYNANPVTMLESIRIFQKQADPALPHLYVLGQIAELGRASDGYHFEMGSHMRVRPQDTLLLIGERVASLREGLLSAGHNPSQIKCFTKTEAAASFIETFRGVIFLKGSRYHRLERLTMTGFLA